MSVSTGSDIRHFSSVKSIQEIHKRALRKGILLQDVDKGNPCVACGDKCPGFELHVWRKVCQHCRCSKDNHRSMAHVDEESEEFPRPPPTFRYRPVTDVVGGRSEIVGEKIRENGERIPNGGAHVLHSSGGNTDEEVRDETRDVEQMEVNTEKTQVQNQTVDVGLTAMEAAGDLPSLDTNSSIVEPPVEQVELSKNEKGFDEATILSLFAPDDDNPTAESVASNKRGQFDLQAVAQTNKDDDPEGSSDFEGTAVDAESLGFMWIPQGLTKDQVIRFMDGLPEDKVPKVGSCGVDYWVKQQTRQLPEHDLHAEKCHGLDEGERQRQESYKMSLETGVMAEGKAAEIIDDGVECWQCHEIMLPGDMAVQAEIGSGSHMWHPSCFTCNTDKELLVPLIYFYSDDKIFCGRHYGETLMPRCHACDELIFCQHYTVAEEHSWHQKHFCCFSCDEPLSIGDESKAYVNHDDHIYCTTCYAKEVAEHCHGCGTAIGAGDKRLIHEDTNWHTACFICSRCEAELASMPFYRREEKYLCQTCFEGAFGKVCAHCNESIQTSSKSFVLSGKHWHESCFVCSYCKESLAGRPMINHDTGLYCPGCYYEALGEKCEACKKPLGSEGGVTYGTSTYHRDCFSCEECRETLAGKQFTRSPDGDKLHLCLECYDRLYAKKCMACSQPIVASSSSYMALGDQYWHETCFLCSECKTSLSGTGFFQRDGALFCGKCGNCG